MDALRDPAVDRAGDLNVGAPDDDAVYQAARDAVASLFGMSYPASGAAAYDPGPGPPRRTDYPDYRSLSRLEAKRAQAQSEAWSKSLRRPGAAGAAVAAGAAWAHPQPDTLLPNGAHHHHLASNGSANVPLHTASKHAGNDVPDDAVESGSGSGLQRRPSPPLSPARAPAAPAAASLIMSAGKLSSSTGSLTSSGLGGSPMLLDDLLHESELQLKRRKAFIERVMEQHDNISEQKRHSDILELCERLQGLQGAELAGGDGNSSNGVYSSSSGAKPQQKSSRIKTNGSLPRDKSNPSDLSPTFPVKSSSSSSSDDIHLLMAAAGARAGEAGGAHPGDSPGQGQGRHYEASPLSAPGSPRRGIRTVVAMAPAPNESFTFPQEITSEVIEKRLDLPGGAGPHTPKVVSATAKDGKVKVKAKGPLVTSTPRERGAPGAARFILPLEEVLVHQGRGSPDDKVMALSLELEFVQKERLKIMSGMTVLKARLGEIDGQLEEAARAAAIEKAFVGAELSSQAERARVLQARIAALRERADQCQREVESWQENRIAQQRVFSMSLEHAEQELERLQQEERRAQDGADQAELRDRALQQADVVETEKKLYEDLEFKYLEEESVWLARREELSKELADAVRKHEETVARLQELEAAAQVAELEGSMEGYEEQRQAYLQRLHEGQAQLDMLDGRVDELVGQGAANLTGASSTSLNDLDSNSSDPFSNSGLTSMESSFCSYIEVKPRAAEDGKECAYSGGVGGNNVDKSRCPGDVPPGSRSPPSGASDMSLVAARPVGNRTMADGRDGAPPSVPVPAGPGRPALAAGVPLAEANARGRLAARLLEPRGGRVPAGGEEDQHEEEDRLLGALPALPAQPAPGLHLQRGPVQLQQQLLPRAPGPRRQQRPLTRYLPIRTADLDLRQHIESAGHAVELCRHVQVDGHSCRGELRKASARFGNWQKRWFVFDRSSRTLAYYKSKRDTRVRGGIHFQAIAEVYVDHTHGHKHTTPNSVFVVKTTQRAYQLMAPSPEAMRIWVDVIFTGAEAYQEFD